MTERERRFNGVERWIETDGGHIDLVGVTICAGSRGSDGDAPNLKMKGNSRKNGTALAR